MGSAVRLQWHSHWRLSAVLSGGCWASTEGTCHVQTSCRLWEAEQQTIQELGLFVHPAFLPGHSLLSCGLPLWYHLLRILAQVESAWDTLRILMGCPPMGAHRRGNHALPELPGSASITSDPQSPLPYCCKDGSVHRAQRLVCVTGSRGRQVHRTCPSCRWTALGLGITVCHGSWKAGCLAQVRRVPGARCPAQQWRPWLRQTSAQLAGWSSWRLWCWHQPGFQW